MKKHTFASKGDSGNGDRARIMGDRKSSRNASSASAKPQSFSTSVTELLRRCILVLPPCGTAFSVLLHELFTLLPPRGRSFTLWAPCGVTFTGLPPSGEPFTVLPSKGVTFTVLPPCVELFNGLDFLLFR